MSLYNKNCLQNQSETKKKILWAYSLFENKENRKVMSLFEKILNFINTFSIQKKKRTRIFILVERTKHCIYKVLRGILLAFIYLFIFVQQYYSIKKEPPPLV